MSKGRLEAFSDGVIAIIITIMVLEMKVPHGTDLEALQPLLPVFLTYVLSYVFVGIYWNNHHHMLHASKQVDGRILWANLHLLFWLSLVPFVTRWLGENHGGSWPTALYGIVLLMAAIAYTILQQAIIAHHGRDSLLAVAVGSDVKSKASLAAYVVAIAGVRESMALGSLVRRGGGDVAHPRPADRGGGQGMTVRRPSGTMDRVLCPARSTAVARDDPSPPGSAESRSVPGSPLDWRDSRPAEASPGWATTISCRRRQ